MQGHLSFLTSQHSTRRQAKQQPMNQVSKADLCLCIEVYSSVFGSVEILTLVYCHHIYLEPREIG